AVCNKSHSPRKSKYSRPSMLLCPDDARRHPGILASLLELHPVLIALGLWPADGQRNRAPPRRGIFSVLFQHHGVRHIVGRERCQLLAIVFIELYQQANAFQVELYALIIVVANGEPQRHDAAVERRSLRKLIFVAARLRPGFHADGHAFVRIQDGRAQRFGLLSRSRRAQQKSQKDHHNRSKEFPHKAIIDSLHPEAFDSWGRSRVAPLLESWVYVNPGTTGVRASVLPL